MGRIIGVDYGTVRIGLAISDETKILARVLPTILTEKKLELTVGILLTAISAYTIDTIILGHPLKMNGTKGILSDEVEAFKQVLEAKTSIPVILWDERLTSVQAERTLRETSLTRKKRSKIVDATSAVILLQSYLDNLSFKGLHG